FIDSIDTALKQSVWSSAIAASICPTFLRPGGLLGLTGSIFALKETPRMISYGMSKSAVYHMTKSLSKPGSGMPVDTFTFAINILDTPNNRKMMPKADRSTWSPLESVAEVLLLRTRGICWPKSGSLIKFTSKDGKTEYCYDDSA
ncbi:unnamed protein product, partial [Hymenolepis diminuta]|uniref:NAD(P)-binding protein n=1 Tax=Hymenolepis diminuta TaxID=6216 RepID=A0A0R3SDZ8_HYMDI